MFLCKAPLAELLCKRRHRSSVMMMMMMMMMMMIDFNNTYHASTCLCMQSAILFHQFSPSVRPSVSLSVCLSVRLSVCLSVCPSVCLSVCPSVCLSVCLSVRLSVRPMPVFCLNKWTCRHVLLIIILVFEPRRRYKIPRGTTSAGALNTREGGKNFLILPFISKTVRDRLIVTMEH